VSLRSLGLFKDPKDAQRLPYCFPDDSAGPDCGQSTNVSVDELKPLLLGYWPSKNRAGGMGRGARRGPIRIAAPRGAGAAGGTLFKISEWVK
jgi:hypothetical protein